MPKEYVILVDKDDLPIGSEEKMEAHRRALLHRAISVFIVNSKGEWLIQRRATAKYHSGGLWTNTCCTHPQLGESTAQAAKRRLLFEMDAALGVLRAGKADDGALLQLTGVYHNLLRQWADT